MRMSLIGAIAGAALLSGCALITSAQTGKPLDPAQVQADLANATYLMRAAGCALDQAATSAAPIVAIAGDAQGQQVLQAVDASGKVQCSLTVPRTALPVPAPANAAPATAPAPAS